MGDRFLSLLADFTDEQRENIHADEQNNRAYLALIDYVTVCISKKEWEGMKHE
jgi:hypothetical protein